MLGPGQLSQYQNLYGDNLDDEEEDVPDEGLMGGLATLSSSGDAVGGMPVTGANGIQEGGLSQLPSNRMTADDIEKLAGGLKSMNARNAYYSALQSLSQRAPDTGRVNIPLLMFAAGLLKPTQGGTFGEALSQAGPPALGALAQQRESEFDQQQQRDMLGLKALEGQAEDERSDEEQQLRLLLSKYGKRPIRVNTAEGVFLVDADSGQTLRRLGDLPPNQAQPANMYEKESDKLSAKDDAEFYNTSINQGQIAYQQQASLDAFTEILDSTSLEGAGAPMLASLLSFAQTFGIDPSRFNAPNAAPAEVARMMGSTLTLDETGGSLGTGISSSDRDFITNQFMNIANTKEANAVIAEILRRLNYRKQQIGDFANDYYKKNKSYDGIRSAVYDEFKDKTIFDKEFRDRIQPLLRKKGQGSIRDAFTRLQMPSGAQIEMSYRRGDYGPPDSDEAKAKRDELLKEVMPELFQ